MQIATSKHMHREYAYGFVGCYVGSRICVCVLTKLKCVFVGECAKGSVESRMIEGLD